MILINVGKTLEVPMSIIDFKETPIPSSLEGGQCRKLEEMGVTIGFYWYHQETYSGRGYLLYQLNDYSSHWWLHEMSHCSCFGPLTKIKQASCFETLGSLCLEITNELFDEIEDLLNFAQKWEDLKNGSERINQRLS